MIEPREVSPREAMLAALMAAKGNLPRYGEANEAVYQLVCAAIQKTVEEIQENINFQENVTSK